MEPVSARFEKFEPVHRVSGKIFYETGLQTGLSDPGHSLNSNGQYMLLHLTAPLSSFIIFSKIFFSSAKLFFFRLPMAEL